MLSENIKTLRKAKGLSQEELAVKLNVVRQTISKWEQGRSVPDSELFVMCSNGFTAKFEFKGGVDIGAIGRMISQYVLE